LADLDGDRDMDAVLVTNTTVWLLENTALTLSSSPAFVTRQLFSIGSGEAGVMIFDADNGGCC
jgi:hypothetical protein